VGSAADLHHHGLDRLKSALTALGLKCGGTLEQRAERLFSVKGLPRSKWPKNVLAAPPKKNKEASKPRAEVEREIAGLEARVYHLASTLSEIRDLTRENVERKQARSAAEMVQEDEAEIADMIVDEEEDDDDDVPYNPKGLPLGWDGKPIPYWLYKLHGLNVRYSCEICGNYVYVVPVVVELAAAGA
jgi:splicing factor 3A subunit 3